MYWLVTRTTGVVLVIGFYRSERKVISSRNVTFIEHLQSYVQPVVDCDDDY